MNCLSRVSVTHCETKWYLCCLQSRKFIPDLCTFSRTSLAWKATQPGALCLWLPTKRGVLQGQISFPRLLALPNRTGGVWPCCPKRPPRAALLWLPAGWAQGGLHRNISSQGGARTAWWWPQQECKGGTWWGVRTREGLITPLAIRSSAQLSGTLEIGSCACGMWCHRKAVLDVLGGGKLWNAQHTHPTHWELQGAISKSAVCKSHQPLLRGGLARQCSLSPHSFRLLCYSTVCWDQTTQDLAFYLTRNLAKSYNLSLSSNHFSWCV